MNTFWTIIWEVLKWSAILGGGFALISLLIVIFHPIYINLFGRLSMRGQRGEIGLNYLFNLLKLKFVASQHTQDVWLEFCGLKKLLQRESVSKPKQRISPEPEAETEPKPESGSGTEKGLPVEKSLTCTEDNLQNSIDNYDTKEADEKSQSLLEATIQDKGTKSETATTEEEKPYPDHNFETDIKVEATPEQLAELQSILEADEAESPSEKNSQNESQKIRDNLRKFKKDFARRYNELRKKLRLTRQKWNSLYPVLKRFWCRGKKGFTMDSNRLKINYSLEEHYLTGMFCGYLAPTIGFARRYGLVFEPIPMFPDKPNYGIYTKASSRLIIKPWRLLWAVFCLFFEKNVYKELFWLINLKREKKRDSKL